MRILLPVNEKMETETGLSSDKLEESIAEYFIGFGVTFNCVCTVIFSLPSTRGSLTIAVSRFVINILSNHNWFPEVTGYSVEISNLSMAVQSNFPSGLYHELSSQAPRSLKEVRGI